MTAFERMNEIISGVGKLSAHGIGRVEQWLLYGFANHIASMHPNSTILDLGTNIGNSLAALAAGVGHARLYHKASYSVDVLIQTVDNGSFETFDMDRIDQLIPVLMDEFAIRIEFIMADDADFLDSLPDEYASFIFHDSLHLYRHVSKVLDLSIPKTIKGACIAGHDYALGHPGVMRAVDEWRKREIPQRIAGSQVDGFVWWSQKL